MAWTVVPCLDALRDQLDEIAPHRDTSSDGSIGDTSHAARPSSHNPDRTGSPEYRDGDAADEIRARDFDKDLNQPGLSMLMTVRHLVEGARSGEFWWLRYLIYQGVIYHRSYGFAARAYTGVNKHDHHAHVNSDFTQAADTVRGVDYHLEDLVMPSADDIAAAVIRKLDGAPIDKGKRTLGGSIGALCNDSVAGRGVPAAVADLKKQVAELSKTVQALAAKISD